MDERKEAPASGKAASTASSVLVERLTHEDIPAVCALYKRVWDMHRSELPAEIVKSWEPTPLEFTSRMEGITYFAARDAGRIVGVVGCAVADGSCELVQLVVDPDVRRRGIGSQLIHAAVDWARHSNVRSVWVDALAQFTSAGAMLKRLGFDEAGLLHRHFWGEDVRFFEKLL